MSEEIKKSTINDVALFAGVSKATVSAVINMKDWVKSSTRERVVAAMKELHFHPQGLARNLKQISTKKSIGLIIKDLINPFYTAVAMGVKEYANEKGYLVFITSSENDHEFEEEFSKLFSIKDIKGAIIAPVLEGTAEIEHLFKLKMINYPFVLLEDVKGIQSNVVSIDNVKAMKSAVKFLIKLGHKRIVHFAGPESSSHTHERIDGFQKAFSESHLIFNNEMIVSMGAHYEESYDYTLKYFRNRDQGSYPTAIICFNDQQALGVIAALNQLNIRIPDDISLIGNDDIYFAKLYPVPLTTIQAPMHEMGRKAAEILIRNIESLDPLPIEKITLKAKLIERRSTKALPEKKYESVS